jgi:hypothetical protein
MEVAQTEEQQAGGDHGHHDITVEVFVPSQVEGKSFTWPRNRRVGDAAEQAAAAFGIQGWTPSLQNEAGKVLDRDKPLVAEGVRDGDKLELVDAGGGV